MFTPTDCFRLKEMLLELAAIPLISSAELAEGAAVIVTDGLPVTKVYAAVLDVHARSCPPGYHAMLVG